MNNVETLSNVAHILAEEPDWLRQWGTEAHLPASSGLSKG